MTVPGRDGKDLSPGTLSKYPKEYRPRSNFVAMKQQFAIVIEKAGDNYSAYAPDVPGCITVGDTIEEAERNMVEALEFHFEGLIEQGETPPSPSAVVSRVDALIPTPAAVES